METRKHKTKFTKYLFDKCDKGKELEIVNNESNDNTIVVLFSSGDEDMLDIIKNLIKTKYQETWFFGIFIIH